MLPRLCCTVSRHKPEVCCVFVFKGDEENGSLSNSQYCKCSWNYIFFGRSLFSAFSQLFPFCILSSPISSSLSFFTILFQLLASLEHVFSLPPSGSHLSASVFPSPLCSPLPDLDNVEGISVDWIGNNLYWTNDGYRKTISVARLAQASQTRKTLLEGDMSHPRAIVVDPLNRLDTTLHFILI